MTLQISDSRQQPELTGERIGKPEEQSILADRILYARQFAAYEIAIPLLPPESRVLDLACGTGYGTCLLAQHCRQCTGVDVDPETVAHCRKTLHHRNCRFEIADGCELPFPDNSFDFIVSFQTIEHVPHHHTFVRELRRVLTDEGRCLITTPNRQLRLADGERPWNRFHVREYDADQLRTLLHDVFRNVEIHGLHATEDIMKFEYQRLATARRHAKWDPLRLRHRIPGWLRSWLLPVTRMRSTEKREPLNSSTEFFLTSETTTSLDLFAKCS